MDAYDDALKFVEETIVRCNYDPGAAPHAIRVVLLVEQIEFEIAVGGVVQWLTNSSGRYARETVDAFDEIGAHTCAGIVREMLAPFPEGAPSKDEATRVKQVQDLVATTHAMWSEQAKRLLAWPDDIDALLRSYVAAHPAEFRSAG